MNIRMLLLAGALYCFAFALFHAAFWKLGLMDWKRRLPKLDDINRGAYQVLNLCLIICFLLFAAVSWFHRQELVSTPLGRTVLGFILGFWLLRAIFQLLFFPRTLRSFVFFAIFLVGAGIYGSVFALLP